MAVRAPRPDELEFLRDIERAAGTLFRTVGMPEIAEGEPTPISELERFRAVGRAWVAVDDNDRPFAYVITEIVDGGAHVEQVSVHPAHARRGIGRLLLDHVAARAVGAGLPVMTLTTFRDVPWNAPYYERCGFHVLDENEIGPELRGVLDRESAHGLDPTRRVCMRRDLM